MGRSGVCSRNEANTMSQISVNPSEDDTNMYPSSVGSFHAAKEDSTDKGGNSQYRYNLEAWL